MKYSKFIDSIRQTSLVDFPGEICCVIYTQGCNMNCSFCYSKHLIPQVEGSMSWEDTLGVIGSLNNIGAVTFTGGEPTIHDLTSCILDLRDMKLKIGLETNGRGEYYQKILPFVDYILLSKYTPEILEVTKALKSKNCILETIDVIIP